LDRQHHAGAEGLRKGAYVLREASSGQAALILIASGSEVGLILDAADKLEADGVATRCVSMPSWELFDAQSPDYREQVLPAGVAARLAVEMGATQGWLRYVGARGDVLGIDHFGASAPAEKLLQEFGFTVDNVVQRAKALLGK
jgi:transketolase